jgi:eukaryotic-like serine/threonine-protein kinase
VTAHLQPDVLVDGRYRLVERIGSGGMADVWCATDQQLGRRVALKVLHPRFAADPQFVERFRREASHAAGLQHPNVVAVFDRGEWDGTPYIAMEHIEGPTLKEIVRDRGALAPALAADVVVQILRAARYAHKHGIVHRDLKPHNVILDEEGRVKVTDFGIARAGASEMTETGAIMGTAHYLSPEQAQGLPVDGRSDLYSIGVILYELLTGRVPFDAESPVSIAVRHVSEPPIPPAEVNPAVPPALDAVTMRALAKAPEDRFQDADAFIAALQAARDAPMEATAYAPVGPVVVEEDPHGRRWWLWLLALLALAAIAVGAYLLLAPEQATVPDVVGQRSSVAAQTLQNRGFEVDIQRVINADVPKDRVATQNPSPGEQADQGSTVRLVVSDGPGSGTVPHVTGMPQAQAEKLLRSAGFKVADDQAYSSDVRAGRVISSSPPEGTTAEKGATVRLTVSRGARPVAVPSVVGRSVAEARGELEGKGFKVTETDQQTTSKPDGTVLSQSPAAGSSVKPGTTVSLTVAKAPPQVQIPDVTGDTKDEARQALRDNRLQVKVLRRDVDTPDEDGMVVAQDPQAGTSVDRGTLVTITVGTFTPPPTSDSTPTPSPTPTPTATSTP